MMLKMQILVLQLKRQLFQLRMQQTVLMMQLILQKATQKEKKIAPGNHDERFK
jgi:ribosomal protein L29